MTTTKKIVRRRRPVLPLKQPVNIKVKGERVMRKNVILDVHPSDPYSVVVKTGRRGRPASLTLDNIERFRVL